MIKNNKGIILLVLVLSIVTAKGQTNDYIAYYNLCNEARLLKKNNQDSIALIKFQEAFSLVEYVYTWDYSSALYSASKVNEFSLMFDYSKEMILNGILYEQPSKHSLNDFLKEKKFKKFRKTKYYKTILDSIPNWTTMGMERKNMIFSRKIDSLQYIDQKIRKAGGLKNIYKTKIKNYTYDLDTLIFSELIKLIRQYGFPSEKKVGFYSYMNVTIILLHNIRLAENHSYFFFIQKAFDKGEYLPADYAWLYDSMQNEKGEEKLYYYHKFSTKDLTKVLSKEKVEQINNERKKIGLKLIRPKTKSR